MGAVWLGSATLGASKEVPVRGSNVTRRAELLPVAILRQHVENLNIQVLEYSLLA
jgi:hypothetical protein